jgi:hypothetical protein
MSNLGSVTAADREGLGAIIGRFPSGFQSADLGSARALLREGR